MALRISATASSANYIAWAENPPFDMTGNTQSFRLIFRLNATPGASNRLLCKNASASTVQSWGQTFTASSELNPVAWWESTVNEGTGGVALSTTLAIGTWYDYVFVFDKLKSPDKVTTCINGVQEYNSDSAISTNPDTTTTVFSIGKDQRTGNNGGPIDVQYFQWVDSALTVANALALYNGGTFKTMEQIGITPTHSYPMLTGSSTSTIEDTIGSLDGTGSGVTDPGVDAPMYSGSTPAYQAHRTRGFRHKCRPLRRTA